MSKLSTILRAAAALVVLPALASAQYNGNSCGPNTIVGTYVVTCSGFITPAPNTASLPFSLLGTVTGDKDGVFAGATTTSLAGTVFPQVVSGQSSTASDCTGAITYNKGAKDELNVKYVVLANGDEVRGMVVDKGANVLCTLTKIKQ